MMFTTKDSDNIKWGDNCAASSGNGWWFNICHHSNLNSVYHKNPKTTSAGMIWHYWANKNTWVSLKSSKMILGLDCYIVCSVG